MFSSSIWFAYFQPPNNCSNACTTQGFIGFILASQHEFHSFMFGKEEKKKQGTLLIILLYCNIHCDEGVQLRKASSVHILQWYKSVALAAVISRCFFIYGSVSADLYRCARCHTDSNYMSGYNKRTWHRPHLQGATMAAGGAELMTDRLEQVPLSLTPTCNCVAGVHSCWTATYIHWCRRWCEFCVLSAVTVKLFNLSNTTACGWAGQFDSNYDQLGFYYGSRKVLCFDASLTIELSHTPLLCLQSAVKRRKRQEVYTCLPAVLHDLF